MAESLGAAPCKVKLTRPAHTLHEKKNRDGEGEVRLWDLDERRPLLVQR